MGLVRVSLLPEGILRADLTTVAPILELDPTAFPFALKISVFEGTAYHVIPSLEYPIEFVPRPTATNLVPFQHTFPP